MASNSKIEWTSATWNPVTGCSKISAGCKNCYAEKMAKRLHAMGNPSYLNGFEVTCHDRMLDVPLGWKKSRNIFVNSMSDLFHENVPFEFIQKVFSTMLNADWHIYQVLTKRSRRLKEISKHLKWTKNIWMGVSVENNDVTERIDELRDMPALTKFLSIEPLIGPLPEMNLEGIDWVIVGGESGPGARPIELNWVLDIKEQCQSANIPFFFKQWGGVNKKKNGRELEGRTWDEMPQHTLLSRNH